ncbi:MAG TPA: DUF4332 domain-containing protein [Candidatus Lokiarchaeia archaeon]|nr:DUF4332 domain-containing protein [Candidatus Lokiarchaeia archaeon]
MVKFKFDAFDDIGPFYGPILKKTANLETVDDFLRETNYGADYAPLLAKLNATVGKQSKHAREEKKRDHEEIDEEKLVRWGRIFDLFRVPRVSPRIAELLVAADINSARELSYLDPAQVLHKMQGVDEDTYFIIIEEPSITDVERWIHYAKLLTRRKKFGLDIPLVNVVPMMTLEIASELQKYKIWTIEDLDENISLIPSLYSRIGMPRGDYMSMLGVCDLCRVDGIDIIIARMLYLAGIKSLKAFRDASLDDLCGKLQKVMPTIMLVKQYPALVLELARNGVDQLQHAAKEMQTKTFLEAIA